MTRLPVSGSLMAGRETAFRFGSDTDAPRSLVRAEEEREVEFDALLRRGAGREAAGLEEREGA